MKKSLSILSILGGFALLMAGAMILSSCEGPQGLPGKDGVDGVDGTNGVDANATCTVCHNSDVVLLAKEEQAMSSHHLTGGNYGRNAADCARCHTSQGFTEYLETGTVAADIDNPAPINCRTCHMIHMNYDEGDWDLVTESAVEFDVGGVTADFGGPSNLCVNCHQFREIDPMPVMGGGDVEITNSRWGPHHGPQGNDLWGVSGYEIAGSMSYPTPGSHAHAGAGCNTCHMASIPEGGITSGGHTFNMTYVFHGATDDNINGCEGCHSSIEDFDLHGFQTDIDTLVAQLEAVFIANGYMDGPGELWNTPLTVSADMAGAMLNYSIVMNDGSSGVHNPPYIKALLTNSLEAVQ